MRRWAVGFCLVLLAALPILVTYARGGELLKDTDTAVLLAKIRERNAPLTWFAGDWPLENHFYRPISTLVFEMDNALYGSNPAGYGFTNAALAFLSILALFWFLRELTESPWIATGSAALFALWHIGATVPFVTIGQGLFVASLVCALLPRRNLVAGVSAALCWWFLIAEIDGITALRFRMLDWLPGRTASCMTLFALLAMACYARFERTSAQRLPPPEPGPLDPPATKGTSVRTAPTPLSWLWALGALAGLALALGSYEQTVMLPAALLGTAICLRWQRYRVRWQLHIAFWALLGGYLALRAATLPTDVSAYQAQQFRSGSGVLLSLMDYVFPAFASLLTLWNSLELGAGLWLTSQPWQALLGLASNVGAAVRTRKDWVLPLTGWALSIVAYLPMAWMKHFDHYHYWPMAMRALFVVAVAGIGAQALVSAVSRPARQAPPRPDPAPGSLPRP